jgi:hypothetical protein
MKNKERQAKTNKEYHDKHKEEIKERKRLWYIQNKEKIKIVNKTWRDNNKEHLLAYQAEYTSNKYKNDPIYKINTRIRKAIKNAFKIKGFNKKSKTQDILGCTFDEFKIYLESKFEPWMTWDNHGKCNNTVNFGWDIDHIIPLSTAKTEEDLIKLNHYSNLQPLCSYINRFVKKNNLPNV